VIPLRDDVPSRTVPLVNYALIGLNVFAFILELGLGRGLERFLYQAAVVPALYAGRDGVLHPVEVLSTSINPDLGSRVLVSMFLHGGWAHIIGNMLYLWVFGNNVEDVFGHVGFIGFYLVTGLAASFLQIMISPNSRIPNIGASGAIAGVLGAYLIFYPRARIDTLVGRVVVPLPALYVLGFWIVLQFFQGIAALTPEAAAAGGVAWWAHIGGFVAGVVIAVFFRGRVAAWDRTSRPQF